jgi:hypothetical protein
VAGRQECPSGEPVSSLIVEKKPGKTTWFSDDRNEFDAQAHPSTSVHYESKLCMRAVTGVLSVIVMICLPLAALGQGDKLLTGGQEDQVERSGGLVSLENLRQYIETATVEVRTLDAQLIGRGDIDTSVPLLHPLVGE